MRRGAMILSILLALLVLPGVAAAGEVTGTGGSYTYTDTAGNQVNDLVVTHAGNDTVFTDVVITENSTECSAASNVVTCTFATTGNRFLDVALAGGDDKADTSGGGFIGVDADGGAGGDTITGGLGNDRFNGGEGADVLIGLGGSDDLDGQGGGDDLRGGDGNDTLHGGAGPDMLSGGTNDDRSDECGDVLDYEDSITNLAIVLDDQPNDASGDGDTIAGDLESINAGTGNDSLTGNERTNCFSGAEGNDTLLGLAGDDRLSAAQGTDTVDGGTGDDELGVDQFGAAADPGDVVIGGEGVDGVEVFTATCDLSVPACSPRNVTITLDGQADDGGQGEGDDVRADVEDVFANSGFALFFTLPGTATVTGTAQFNFISTDEAADTVDPGSGSDSVETRGGDDTINARDGFSDRIDCGDGTDTTIVDQLDAVADCETVNRETVPLPFEDHAPTVALTAPATIDPAALATLRAEAADDHGIQRVVFMDDDRVICTDDAAPYECAYQPGGADVGATLLTAAAVDTAEQGAFAQRAVTVGKFRAARLTIAFRRGRVSGRLELPAALGQDLGCSGTVRVTVRVGGRTATRKAKLSKACRYRIRVRVRRGARARVGARFGGNERVESRTSRSLKL